MRITLLLSVVCGINLTAVALAQTGPLDVYWTDTPPTLNGQMDDACWADAVPITNFKGSPAPTQKTELRIAYDGANLYLFWTLFEDKMEQVVMGDPETRKDQFARQIVDAVEVQIYPGRTAMDFLMFISSPRGARYDIASRGSWNDYDPDWRSVPGRFTGGWTLEQRIPFAELAQPGTGFSTPAVGDQWRIQAYRKKHQPQEVSGWGAGEPPPPDYTNLIFRGRKSGDALPGISLKRPELSYGTGVLSLAVRGAPTPLKGVCRIFRDGKEQTTSDATLATADGNLDLPLRLQEPGDYRVRFELSHGTQVFFSGQEMVRLPPLAELFPTVSQNELAAVRELLADDRCTAFAAVRRRLTEFERLQGDAQQLIARRNGLRPDDWRRLEELRKELLARWPALQYDLNLAKLYPGKRGEADRPFALGAATESNELYPDTRYQGSLTEPVRLALAGNEYGSFQLAVIPFWTDLKAATVAFSPLRTADGREIAADNLCWFRVGYVTLENPRAWLRLRYQHPAEPDPLLPAAPFDVTQGTLAAIWIDVHLPAGTPAGMYKGQVSVIADGQTVARPIEVESYGFDIPVKSSIANEFWFVPSNWQKFYGSAMKYTPELHARHAAVLGRYRIGSFPCDWLTLCQQVPIYAEADGHFTFDWTTFDRYVRNALDNGTTAFWSALSCNSGWTNYLHNPKVRVIERATGKAVELGQYIPPVANCWDLASLPYRENKVYREFLQAYVKHLKELGINDQSYYELFDEPSGDRFLEMLRHHRFFREVVPNLKLLDFSTDPVRSVDGQTAVGLLDAWAPHIERLEDPAVLAAMRDRRAKHGEKLWTYTCVEVRRDATGNTSYNSAYTEDGYSPYCLYHRPYIALRIQPWMAWKYQLDGFYIFMLNAVPPSNAGKSAAERWPNSAWSDGQEQGCGTLIYPGPDCELIPGMRLANIRDGMEDYEFFATLKAAAAKLDPAKYADLQRRVTAALAVDPDIVGSVFDWTKDRKSIETKRAQLAALIVEALAAKKQP